jgi:tRNA(Ile)-lysidine synthase
VRRLESPEPPPLEVRSDDSRLEPLLKRCRFPPPGAEAVCAVSGGADSTALAVLAVAHGLVVTLAHVDHGLRPGSHAEAGRVEQLAARLGCSFASHRVEVAMGPNLEARAREARYGVLPADVMTAHTADDQAETMVLQLLRGAGLTGLAGMRPGTRRPLLALRRHDTVQICTSFGLEVIDDPMNRDPRFTRVRVRREVLPLLSEVAQRDVVAVLARQAPYWADDDALLEQLATEIDPTDARAVRDAPVALARRALRRWLADPLPPSAAEMERVWQVVRGERLACELEGGRRVTRSQQRLSIETSSIGS